MISHIKDTASFDAAIKKDRVLVDFFATWCGPCSMLSPLVEKLATDHPEIEVVKVDVDQAEELAARYNVSSIPTLIYFEKGQAIRQSLGYIPEDNLKRFVGVK
jgi:thioredoxin 1